jgi:hypothetical protein
LQRARIRAEVARVAVTNHLTAIGIALHSVVGVIERRLLHYV